MKSKKIKAAIEMWLDLGGIMHSRLYIHIILKDKGGKGVQHMEVKNITTT